MRGDKYSTLYNPHSQAHLDKFAGGPNGAFQAFLYPFARQHAHYVIDDFAGDTLNGDLWHASADVSATTWAIPASNAIGGILQGNTGAVDNSGLGLYGHPTVSGDYNAWMEVRFKIDNVASDGVQVETGLINAVTDPTLPVVDDVDTPSNGSNGGTDFAVFHLDGDQTLKTAAFVTDGSTSNMNCSKSNLLYSLTNATYTTVRIGVAGDVPHCIVDNNPVYTQTKSHGSVIGSRVEGGTLLRPWFYVRTRAATDRVTDIDYIAYGCDRSAR